MMLWSFEGKGLTPAAEISCPKYFTDACPSTHLEALMAVQVDEGELETREDLVH